MRSGQFINDPAVAGTVRVTNEQVESGSDALSELGISSGTPFICFHVRDSAYLESLFPRMDLSQFDYLNSSLQNYIPVAEEMVQRGYLALRIGAIVKDRLDAANPMIIDLAPTFEERVDRTKYMLIDLDAMNRTERHEIFVSMKCQFFICSSSRVETLPMVFGRPTAFVNHVPLNQPPAWGPQDLWIPRKFWLRAEQRLLTFREIVQLGICEFNHTQQFQESGIDLVENTPEEITDLAVEMDQRLKGEWSPPSDDEALQEWFRNVVTPMWYGDAPSARLGSEFLSQNRDLLK